MKNFFVFVLFCFVAGWFLLLPKSVATSDYVLPYPGPMPGNKLHRVMVIIDGLERYWSWGNIASFRYQLGIADKYLVEAKTLFEYKQYLLAMNSLTISNHAFEKLPAFLVHSKSEGKDVTGLSETLTAAGQAHIEVFERLLLDLPSAITWTPEKDSPTELLLQSTISTARNQRKGIMVDTQSFDRCLQSISSTSTPNEVLAENCWETRGQWGEIIDQTNNEVLPEVEPLLVPSDEEPYM